MPFSDSEIAHYSQMIAAIIDNSPERKKKIDGRARLQLATIKLAIPDANDEVVVTFLVSVASVLARLLATPLGEVEDMARGVFDNNIVAAGHLMGAYDFDSPDVPKWEPEPAPEPEAPATDETGIDDIIGRQYL